MKKIQLALIIACFGLAALLALLGLSKFTTSASGTTIHIYPAAAFALLGLVLLWRAVSKQFAGR